MTNPQLELAKRYVCNTGVSLFLTGKAGTGKTTFLHDIDATVGKRHVVVAPTGVAAVNAGGVTIHSFFQLPLCPYLPDVPELVTEYQMPDKNRQLRKSKIDIIRTLELLIIDEISMVRADLLDAIDATLRRYRHSIRPFGGVQLLMIGDVHQLPPVVTDTEKPYIDRVYSSPFFFNSKALRKLNYLTIELKTVYRQQDEHFVGLLNNVRNNIMDSATLALLNARVGNPRRLANGQEPIRLTTHNYQADAINRSRMDALDGKSRILKATIEGTFPETSAPTAIELELKPKARVMFIKNDSTGQHRYYNGKLGTVKGFGVDENDAPAVYVTDDDGDTMAVGREVWENIQYEIDPDDKQIKQHVAGRFVQYPLRTAWAVTIHKAQGLTFDNVTVDAAEAFAYGQVYVALSRCRSLEGLTLSSPISKDCTFESDEVNRFVLSQPTETDVAGQIQSYEQQYYMDMLLELFGLGDLENATERMRDIFATKLNSLYADKVMLFGLQAVKVAELNGVAERFRRQLVTLSPEALPERIGKGADYFLTQLTGVTDKMAPLLSLDIDNKETKHQYTEAADRLREILGVKVCCLEAVCKRGFSVDEYLKVKTDFMLDAGSDPEPKPAKPKRKTREAAEPHPLITLLIRWRTDKAAQTGVRPYMVLNQKTLLDLVRKLPHDEAELLEVQGVGRLKAKAYGKELLDIVADYCEAYGLKY
ncbi:MAG: HRDC domain-containing protein [Bacteroidales bacterium]|nr:HRDC domain-containing protein [Bacteroidales bacterium]